MKNIKIERFIWIVVIVSVGAWMATAWIASVSFADVWSMVKLLPKVVTFDVIVFGLFAKWLWKWPLFQGWLVPFPNLNGIWIGTVTPIAEADAQNRGIPAVMTIKQSFLTISCVMDTNEMTSESYSANFLIDEDSQLRKLIYIYTSRPRLGVIARSPVHDGTSRLNIEGQPPKRLVGEYWNSRRRVGEIELRFQRRMKRRDIPRDRLPRDAA